jgi:hypothetical protein
VNDSNFFASPKANVDDVPLASRSAAIAMLPVSESWKRKFRLIEKAGGARQPRFKSLAYGERVAIGFNVLGFLFGPIYYACKGMWRKGIALLAACVAAVSVLSVLLELAGLGRFADTLGYGTAAVFAVRANIDYYKKWVLQDNGWW